MARGDQSALNRCIEDYGALVAAIARRLSPTAADAEDAVQEIFLDVWRSAGRYNPALGTEKVFITTIARRRLIDRLRRSPYRVETQSADVLDELGFHDGGLTPEVHTEAERAARVLGRLRPEQRRVIELGVLHGLTHSEIAEMTGMPLGTVKTFIRRGLIQMRQLLGIPQPLAEPAGA